MNEWGFVGTESMEALSESATNCNFNNRCGFEWMERLLLSNPRSSSPDVSGKQHGRLKNNLNKFK